MDFSLGYDQLDGLVSFLLNGVKQILDLHICDIRMIVFLAQVSEDDVLESVMDHIGNQSGRQFIGQMSISLSILCLR